MDQASIFGNRIPDRALRSAERIFRRYARRFSFSPDQKLALGAVPAGPAYEILGLRKLEEKKPGGGSWEEIDREHGIVLGTIRMGFGHYRISLALASAARSMGLKPYWMDLMSFPDTAASRTINYLENLYNLGSRVSQRFRWFDKMVWDKITSDLARQLSNTARDRSLARLFAPLLADLPLDIPFLSTHPWTGHAAVLAGMEDVVTLIPDNYPLAFHLVEGSVHAVQTPSAYMGYRTLRDMGGDKELVHPLPRDHIRHVGHYVDHEIVSSVDEDCSHRLRRLRDREVRRFLLTMGGAGAQARRFADIARACKSAVEDRRLALLINMGDHAGRWAELRSSLDADGIRYQMHSEWAQTRAFAEEIRTGSVSGIHVFLHESFFAAVYATNLLMRAADVMITKPSELAFYPVPKLFIQRVGRHEAWGAIRGSEIGDGTLETASDSSLRQALRLLIEEDDLLEMYIGNILRNARAGIYDGAYGAVHLALERRKHS
ncbi:MAG TPA: hypothetical protein VLH39_02320, partial [Magnetospirillaceae bacterium]|nr:hypothetical protein [Magnetospirillaceae bacterium]